MKLIFYFIKIYVQLIQIYEIIGEFFNQIFNVLEINIIFEYFGNIFYIVFCVDICEYKCVVYEQYCKKYYLKKLKLSIKENKKLLFYILIFD